MGGGDLPEVIRVTERKVWVLVLSLDLYSMTPSAASLLCNNFSGFTQLFLEPWDLCQVQAWGYRHVLCWEGVLLVHNRLGDDPYYVGPAGMQSTHVSTCGAGSVPASQAVVYTVLTLNTPQTNTGPLSLLSPLSGVGAGGVVHVCVLIHNPEQRVCPHPACPQGPHPFLLSPQNESFDILIFL